MIQLIRDFLNYLKILREIELIKINDLSKPDKVKLSTYDRDFEKKINSILLNELAKDLINREYSRDYIIGYRQALISRLSLFK